MLSLVLATSVTVYAEDQNILGTLNNKNDFSLLVAAVHKAGLTETLEGEGSFTVFAPTNAAFDKLSTKLNLSAGDLLNHPRLRDILLYHVVMGKIQSTQMTNCLNPSTLLGQKLIIELVGGLQVNNAFVISADIEASNGIIHGIDTVLMPAFFEASSSLGDSLLEFALSSGKLSVLISALQNAGLLDQVDAEGQITVLAPGNDTLANLLLELNVSAEELLNNPDLSELLKLHVEANLLENNTENNANNPLISVTEDLDVLHQDKLLDSDTDAKVEGVLDAAIDAEVGNGVTDTVKDTTDAVKPVVPDVIEDVVDDVVDGDGLLDLDIDLDIGDDLSDVTDQVEIPNPLKLLP